MTALRFDWSRGDAADFRYRSMPLLTRLATRLTGVTLPHSRTDRLALLVSSAGSPFLTPLYTACAAIWPLAEDHEQFLVWSGVIAVFFIGVGLAFVLIQVLRGKISDVHVSQQAQRQRPFTVAVSSSVLGTLGLWWLGAPWTLMALGSSFAVQGLVFGILTVYRKISMHVAVTASCLTALVLLFGWSAVPLIALLPIQGWARVYRGRHTLSQVAAGALLAPILTVLTLIPWRLSGLVG
jgi:membrane-associated phospholipid phosphatase